MGDGEERSILVAGTGPAGLAAALALASDGARIQLVGPAPLGEDRRTTALMRPAVAFLESLGLAAPLAEHGAPLSTMRIVDATRRLVRGPAVAFHAAEIGEPDFGLNIPNARLNAALAAAVAAQPQIRWYETLVSSWQIGPDHVRAELVDGSRLRAALAVAADGRNSPARQAAGIATRERRLEQSALVLNFGHARHHGFASTEFHTEEGPFTQVPLPGGSRSSLVWVTRPQEAAALDALDDIELALRIEERMHAMLGAVRVEPGRQVYPLASTLPERFAAGRIALVGEAAHVFPPITAQGLNLGLRDVSSLATIVARHRQDPGAEVALAAYDAARRPDIMVRSAMVNLVNATLLSNVLPAQILRSTSLGLLGAVPALRCFFMREGMRPGGGLAALLAGRENKPARRNRR